MKIARFFSFIDNVNDDIRKNEWKKIDQDVIQGIESIKWPVDGKKFTIKPLKNENGVRPIKINLMKHLKEKGWKLEVPISPDYPRNKIDAVLEINKLEVSLEFETGNIASIHRSLSHIMSRKLSQENNIGGILILSSMALARYLTENVANEEGLHAYFDIFRSYRELSYWKKGFLVLYVIEHDCLSLNVPLIPKDTDKKRKIKGDEILVDNSITKYFKKEI